MKSDKLLIPLPALVLPDVHGDIEIAEQMVRWHASDERPVIFLGDYFDSVDCDPGSVRETAQWLMDSVAKPNRYHLLGNGDASYFYFGHPQTGHAPWCQVSHRAMVEIMGDLAKVGARMHLALRVGPWVLSHAGFSGRQLRGAPVSALLDWADGAHIALREVLPHPLLSVGAWRGGMADRGGVLWCDFDHEFFPLPGVNQIVGHGASTKDVEFRALMSSGRVNAGGITSRARTEQFFNPANGGLRSLNWRLNAGMRVCATVQANRFVLHFPDGDIAYAVPSELECTDTLPLIEKAGFELSWGNIPPAYASWGSISQEMDSCEDIQFIKKSCGRKYALDQGPSVLALERSLRKLNNLK